MDNLKYAKCDTPDEEVIEICKNVNLHNIIMNMPDQYNTLVGERGTKLSGGQRQRISIVRALIRRTPILLLDEATSALDVDTEYEVQAVLKKYFSNATMIFISHKLSVLKDMDRIVVLKDGQIIEEGSHQKLYNDTNSYYRIHYT
jgi:ABC-type multidrug transport system fused ATPase/permease subunit